MPQPKRETPGDAITTRLELIRLALLDILKVLQELQQEVKAIRSQADSANKS